MEDKPVPKLDWVPPGTVSLKGDILFVEINQSRIDEMKRELNFNSALDPEFVFSPIVAYSLREGRDVKDLNRFVAETETITVFQRASADFLERVSRPALKRLCRTNGLDEDKALLVLYPEDRFISFQIKKLTRVISELGTFRYNGNLTIELYEPYEAMEAKDASKSETRTGAVYLR